MRSAVLAFALAAQTLACVPSRNHDSRKLAILAGASGDLRGADRFFIEDLREARQGLLDRGWNVRVVAGPDEGVLSGSLPANHANLKAEITRALAKAPPGGQALLLFHTHGQERETRWGQRAHSITSEDRDPSGADPGFDLDELEPAIRDAGSRGVKVAVVDLSCYSGASQALRGAACVVSLASENYVSLCSGRPEERRFAFHFLRFPPKGSPVDLENHFLAARRGDRDSVNLPRISSRTTPLEEDFDRFLSRVDPLDMSGGLRDLRPSSKPFPAGPFLAKVRATVRAKKEGAPIEERTRRALESALAARGELDRMLPRLADDYDEPTMELEVPGRGRLKMGVAWLADYLEKAGAQKGSAEASMDGYSRVQMNLVSAIGSARGGIEDRFRKELDGFRARRDDFDEKADALAAAADRLFAAERELYDVASAPVEGTGCKDFEL